MKCMILGGISVIFIGLASPQTCRSQGSLTYVSSLGQTSLGSQKVGSDSSIAAWILTGNNPGGYVLNSVQLEMAPGYGSPDEFTVSLYSVIGVTAPLPGSSLGTLIGPTDPLTAGTYSYTASGLTLRPSTQYYIVLTSGTTVGNGAFVWNYANSIPNSSEGWSGSYYFLNSSDGSSWNSTFADPLYAVTATAVPEPDILALLGLSGAVFLAWHRWQMKAQSVTGR